MLSTDMRVGLVTPRHPDRPVKLGIIGNHGDAVNLEVSLGYSHARNLRGTQIDGVVSAATDMDGLQVKGGVSYADRADGVQGSGVVSIARRLRGVQVAPICVAGDGSFWQIGVLTIRGSGPWYTRVTPLFGYR